MSCSENVPKMEVMPTPKKDWSAFLAMRLPENTAPVCPSITSFARSQAWAMTGGSSTTTAFSPPTESMLRCAAQ